MKRKLVIIACVLVILVAVLSPLAAHRRQTLGLTMTVKDATSTSATMLCVRRVGFLGGEVDFGSSYYIERLTADGWKKIPTLDPDAAWTAEAYPVPLGISQWTVNYGNSYGKLAPGTYRLCKRFFTHQTIGEERSVLLCAQFEIK